jgi:hypothetical protein
MLLFPTKPPSHLQLYPYVYVVLPRAWLKLELEALERNIKLFITNLEQVGSAAPLSL